MRVMTWNLWGRFGSWESRMEAIALTLADVQPDLCGLQEVWAVSGRNLTAEIAERLGMDWRWEVAEGIDPEVDEEARIGNAILSRWPIMATAGAGLSVADGDESRAILHALVDTPTGPLPIFTTHLTHHLGASQIRVVQVRQVAEFVALHAKDRRYPPVVTGDLNAEPTSDELRLLGGLLTAPSVARQVLIDAWRYADPADPGFTVDRSNGCRTAGIMPSSRIDYILVGLPRRGLGCVQSARLGNAPVDGVWPSDHYAVVADLQC